MNPVKVRWKSTVPRGWKRFRKMKSDKSFPTYCLLFSISHVFHAQRVGRGLYPGELSNCGATVISGDRASHPSYKNFKSFSTPRADNHRETNTQQRFGKTERINITFLSFHSLFPLLRYQPWFAVQLNGWISLLNNHDFWVLGALRSQTRTNVLSMSSVKSFCPHSL